MKLRYILIIFLLLVSSVSALSGVITLDGGSGFIFETQTITQDDYAADIWYNNLEFPANGGEIIDLGKVPFEDDTSVPISGYTNIVDVTAGNVYILKILGTTTSWVKLRVFDNWVEYSPVTFEWKYLSEINDTTPLVIELLSPEDGSVVNGLVEISVYADGPGGIERTHIYIGQDSSGQSYKTCFDTNECTYVWDTTEFENGEYYIFANARDNTNLEWVNTENVYVTVNNSPRYKIAFQSNRDGDYDFYELEYYEIYVMNEDGSGVERLTNNLDWDGNFHWSPDGTKIAFQSVVGDINTEIFVMNSDGSNQINLTNNPNNDGPSVHWSPDGTKIVFNSYRDGNNEIYVMNSDGSNKIKLADNGGCPIWSPDGQKILFQSNKDGNDEIYIMNADGTNQINLTNDLAYDWDPIWSPDGNKIVFCSERTGDHEIYIMNADGFGLERLTNNPTSDMGAVWSPDGSKIAFVSGEVYKNLEIYVMNADGSDKKRLTNSPGYDTVPSWSPIPIESEEPEPEEPLIVDILNPIDNSVINTNSVWLNVNTCRDTVCEYDICKFAEGDGWGGGGCSRAKEMLVTGGTSHSQLITGLENTINDGTNEELYSIHVTCTDSSNKVGSNSIIFTVDITKEGITDYIHLNTGWNLFSIPLTQEDTTVENVISDIMIQEIREGLLTLKNVEEIYGYEQGQWKVWKNDNYPESNTLTDLEAGKGYFIKLKAPAVLHVEGTIGSGEPPIIPTFNVNKGWNLIGYYGTEDVPVFMALRNILGKYSAIWTLFDNKDDQALQGSLKGFGMDEFSQELKRTHGYWLYMQEDGVIVPTN